VSTSIWENLFLCLVRFLEAICIPWLVALSFIFEVSSTTSSNLSLTLTLCFLCHILWLTFLPLSYKDPCDYTGSTWINQDNRFISRSLTITPAKFLLPCKVTYSQVWGIMILGNHCSVYYVLLSGSQRLMSIPRAKPSLHPISPQSFNPLNINTSSKSHQLRSPISHYLNHLN